MILSKLVSELEWTVHFLGDSFNERHVDYVVASDLMSEVLVVDQDNIVLVTSLATDQAIRTANIVDAVAVLFVNGKSPSLTMKKLAEDFDMPLFSTSKPLFISCVKLGKLLGLCHG